MFTYKVMRPKCYQYYSYRLLSSIRLSSHLQLQQAKSKTCNAEGSSEKPLVLFFPWLKAPPSAVTKYLDLYHTRGWDVVTVNGELKHFMWPRKAETVAKEIIAALSSSEHNLHRRPLFVHSLSVGAYIYVVFLMQVMSDATMLGLLQKRLKGQVYDSCVIGGLNRMSAGIAESASKNPFVQGSIKATTWLYFSATKPWTVDFYDRSMDVVYNTPMKAPILVFHSKNDPMSDSEVLTGLVEYWRSKLQLDVEEKCWEKSKHAAHLREHPKEYLQTLDVFLQNVGLNNKNVDKN